MTWKLALRRWFDKVAWTVSLPFTRVLCRLGHHRRAYGGTHRSGWDYVTTRWCPGPCGQTWQERIGPVLSDVEIFERDVLRPLVDR